MSEKHDDGGSAFPNFVPDGHYNGSVHFEGMTLRDYFASDVMATMTPIETDNGKFRDMSVMRRAAKLAYAAADAMLEERAK